MTKKEIKPKIKDILNQKEIKKEEYLYALQLLEEIKEDNIEYYNIISSKLHYSQKLYTKAKKQLLEVLKTNKDHKSAYYQLYKINIQLEEWEEALYNLKKYKELNPKLKINIDLPLQLLELIINMQKGYYSYNKEDYYVQQSEYLYSVKITNKKLLNLYQKLIKEFNNKEFNQINKTISEIEEILEKTNFPIEIKTISKITKSIIEKQNNTHKKIIEDQNFLKENIEEISNDIINGKIQVSKVILYINKIIDIDPHLAEKLLNISVRTNYFSYNEITVKLLQNKIEERKKYLRLTPNDKEKYDSLKEKGSNAYHSHKLDLAYDYYSLAHYITKHPIFEYYIGKIFYKLNLLKEAKKHLTIYSEIGGEKLEKCLLYLLSIELKTKNFKKANKIREKIDIINHDLEYAFKTEKRNQYQSKEQIEEIDYVKYFNSKDIKMKVSDFKEQSQEELQIENYYDYNIEQKLLIIKDLYKKRKIKEANYLLNELKPSTKEEQQKIIQFTKNKKLYLNQ